MTFPTEAERLRAREAYIAVANARYGGVVAADGNTFDRLYPPVVEPAAPKWPNMSYGGTGPEHVINAQAFNATPSPAFAAAVEAFERAVRGAMMSGDTWDIERADRALARVLALYAERQGEEYEVERWTNNKGESGWYVILPSEMASEEGDRVRVSRCGEGDKA